MIFRAISTPEQASLLRSLPALAIDLGFSATNATCGVAASEDPSAWECSMVYNQLRRATTDWLRKSKSPSVLIIEAPLSGGFDADGNPVPRGDFERIGGARHWNIMAGASMALAAIHFCHALQADLPGSQTVHLLEGFASRYTTDPERKPEHCDIARELLRRWSEGEAFARWDAHVVPVSVLQILGDPEANTAPAVLQVPNGFGVDRTPAH